MPGRPRAQPRRPRLRSRSARAPGHCRYAADSGRGPHSLRPGPAGPTRRPHPQPAEGEEWVRAAIVGQLENRGASFYREMLAAVLRAAADGACARRVSASCSTPCGTWCGEAPSPTTRSCPCGRSGGRAVVVTGRRTGRGWVRRAGGTARGCRPVVAGVGGGRHRGRAGGWLAVRDRASSCHRAPPPRPPRRRDPGRCRRGGRHRGVLGGVSHPARDGGPWPGPARVLRGGPGRAQFALPAAVDRLRAERPAPGDDGADAETWWCWQPRTRPTRMVPHCRGHSRRRAA